MRRFTIGLTLAALLGLVACAESTTSDETKTKNAALGPSLVNGDFAPNGGGWVGVGFALDRGCGANTPTASRPSLGAWAKNALAFGYRAAEVRQVVTVPEPSTVELSITGAVRADDNRGWFNVRLADADENATTGQKSGAAAVTPTLYKLKVTTATPNEKVTITLAGSGKNAWRGCYGPVLSKASLSVVSLTSAIVPESTTTTTVPETTTTVPETTTTVPATTTTTPATSTTSPCTPSLSKGILATCKPFKKIDFTMFNRDYSVGTKDLQYGTYYSNGTESSQAISIPPLGIKATITYVDGTTAGPTTFSLTERGGSISFSDVVVRPTADACAPSLSKGILATCKPFKKIDFTMFNRDYSVGTKDLQYATISSNGTESSTAISIPPLGIKATITYVDGTTAGPTIFALTEGVSARQTTTGTSPPTLPTTTTLSTPLTISTTPCNLVVYGYTVTPCQALTSWYVDWYAGDKHLGGTRSSAPTTQRSHGLRDNGWLGAPTRAKVTYTLVDGSTTSPVFVPFDANANETVAAPFATAPLVRLTPTTLAAGATVPPTTLPPIKATSVQATVRPDSTTRCNVDNNTISIGFCKRIGSYVVVFLGLSGEISRVQKRIDNGWATALFLKDLGRPRGVAGLQILVTFTDGTTADVTFDDPWNARGFKTVPVLGQPRPPDACTLSLALGDVLVCRSFTSYTYRWWSADAPLSSVTNKYGVGYRIDLPEPPVGTTRVEVTAQLDDKTAITSTFIPYARP